MADLRRVGLPRELEAGIRDLRHAETPRPSVRSPSLAGCAVVRIIGVDHTGSEPVLVVDFGNGEEHWSMERVRAVAVGAPAWLRDWVNRTTREEEFAHAVSRGGSVGDT